MPENKTPELSPGFNQSAPPDDGLYHVVFKYTAGPIEGVMTRSVFNDRQDYEQWQSKHIKPGTNELNRGGEIVVAHGLSDAEAAQMVSSEQNTLALLTAGTRQLGESLKNMRRSLG